MFEAIDVKDEGSPLPRDTGYQTRFVGHHLTREKLKTAIKGKCRLLQVLGGPVAGKSRLAEQICKELLKESEDTCTQLKFFTILLRNKDAQSLGMVKLKILQEFSEESLPFSIVDFHDDLERILKTQPETYFLVLFDDCDHMISTNFSRTNFLEIVYTLVTFTRVKVIITSRVQFSLPRIDGSLQTTCRLKGLTDDEAKELLSLAAPNVDFTSHCQYILERCCRLPLLLIIVARTLEEKRHMLSAKDLCELWEKLPLDGLSADLVSDEDNIEQIIDKFVASLDSCLQKFLSVFAYFPGTFNAEAAAHVASFPKVSHAKALALIRLHDRSIMEFDADKGRYSILPVIRRHVNAKLTHLRDTDNVRLLFCDFFSKLLTKANDDLVRQSTDVVFSQIYEEWVNVEQTLREGALPTADLFRINMKIVRDAASIITMMVPESAEPFYRQCLAAAEIFGTQKDIGCIEACLGCSVGYSKGNGLPEAIEFLKKAESKLTPEDGYQYVKLMAHFEWNYFRQGNLEEAERYQRMGLEITPSGPGARQIMRQQIAIRNHKALRLIQTGKCEEAIGILCEAIEFAAQNFEHNPNIRVMLNSLGLAYSELKQRDKALKYSKASLAERRKYAKWSPRDLVVPLSNVAEMLSDNKEFGIALKLVDEALEIRKKIAWEHLDTGTALVSKGKVLRKWRKFSEAIDYFEKAYEVHETCLKTHYVLADIGNQIAFCLRGLGRIQEACDRYQQVIDSRHHLQQQQRLHAFILKAFDGLLEISDGDGWSRTAAEMSQFLESLIAQEDTLDSERCLELRDKLHDIEMRFEQRAGKEAAENKDYQEQFDHWPNLPAVNQTKDRSVKMTAGQMSSDCQDPRTVSLIRKVSKLQSNRNNLTQTENKVTERSKCIDTKDMLTGKHARNTKVSGTSSSRKARLSDEISTDRQVKRLASDETESKRYHREQYKLSRESKGEHDPTPSSSNIKYDGHDILRLTAQEHEYLRKFPEEHDERKGDKLAVAKKGGDFLSGLISKENPTGQICQLDLEVKDSKPSCEISQFPENTPNLSDTHRTSNDNTLLTCCPKMMHSDRTNDAHTRSQCNLRERKDFGFGVGGIRELSEEALLSEPQSVNDAHVQDKRSIDSPMTTLQPQINLTSEIQDGEPLLSDSSTLHGESLELSFSETLTEDYPADEFQEHRSQESVIMTGKDVT